MDKVKKYQKIIRKVLQEQIYPPNTSFPNIQRFYMEDMERGHFFVFSIGWHKKRYHHNNLYHIETKKGGQVWIHAYNTDAAVDRELIEAGIDRDDIVGGMVEPYNLEDYQEDNVVEKAA